LIVEKARNLTEGANDTTGEVRDLFRFARDRVRYNTLVLLEVFESYRTSETLERGEGFCVVQAAAVVAIARVVDIPARFHFVGIRSDLAPSRCSRLRD
jgi:transglutaminase-like putative cysteine protease